MSSSAVSGRCRQRSRAVELRIYAHAFIARLYFYMPVLLLHMEQALGDADVSRPKAVALSLISLTSLGVMLAEYPSGLFADWLGHGRTLLLAGALQVVGVGLFLAPPSLVTLAVAQLVVGVATAFRSGADTALLYGYLEGCGCTSQYGGALARLRFFNTLAIGVAGTFGGILFAYAPRWVFILSAVSAAVGTLSLLGLDAVVAERPTRSYGQVFRESFAAMRGSSAVQALVLLGGLSNPFFVLAYWMTQRYLSDAGVSALQVGFVVAAISYLQAATMPFSAWFSRHQRRARTVTACIVVLLPLFLLSVALAWGPARLLGGALLVLVAAVHVLHRNLINLRIQAFTPTPVRASVLSFETWIGALGYVLIFPLAGWLFEARGLSGGFVVLSIATALALWPLLVWSWRSGRLGPAPHA